MVIAFSGGLMGQRDALSWIFHTRERIPHDLDGSEGRSITLDNA
jgi:hypothetical protein